MPRAVSSDGESQGRRLEVLSPRRGRDSKAQGNALGIGFEEDMEALKGRDSSDRGTGSALSGLATDAYYISQGDALGYRVAAPSGRCRTS